MKIKMQMMMINAEDNADANADANDAANDDNET